MRSTIKAVARGLLRRLGIAIYQVGLAQWVINRSLKTRAVLYHAVENESSSYTTKLGINVPPETFALHLDYYSRYYNVISMSEHLHSLDANTSKQPTTASQAKKEKPALLITFDDGYASVRDHALPLLEKNRMSATVYLIGNAVRGRMIWVNRLNQAMNENLPAAREVLDAYPGYPGLNKLPRRSIIHYVQSHFEPEQIEELVKQLEYSIAGLTDESEAIFSSPAEIREMQKRGIEFGFHSNDHYNLGKCSDRELAATLATDGIEDLINSNTFAYPFGYFSPSTIGQLKRQGYKLLLTVGNNNDHYSELHLDRTEVFEPDHARLFARLEIEEPAIAGVKRFVGDCRFKAQQISRGEFRRAA